MSGLLARLGEALDLLELSILVAWSSLDSQLGGR